MGDDKEPCLGASGAVDPARAVSGPVTFSFRNTLEVDAG
jgi:hypothetical protein